MSLSWVTGAAGFIGQHLVRCLAASGARVAGLDIAGPGNLGDAIVAWRPGGLARDALTDLARETGIPETIYHLAGGSSVGSSLVDPLADFQATLGGTAALLDWLRGAARERATRLVIVSSAAVYGDRHAGPITEDAATQPFSPYGAHKFAMEAMCRGWAGSFDLPIVAVRLFSVYGPWLTKQLLWDLCGKLSATGGDVMLGGTGAELRDWTHVDDVIRALIAATALADTRMPVVNAGSGRAGSVRAIAEMVARAWGRDPGCITFSGECRPGDPFSLIAAPGRLDAEGFNWRIEPEKGVADYVRWYREWLAT